jgi:hypothetical protein
MMGVDEEEALLLLQRPLGPRAQMYGEETDPLY